jgi:hypothetical protein
MEHSSQLCDACLEKEYETYRHARVHESMKRNEAWLENFRIGSWPHWEYDHERSRLVFSDQGLARVVADVVVLGTVDKNGTRWEWSWGNPNFSEDTREKMGRIRQLGEERDWAKLTTLFMDNDEYLGWEFASISAHVLDAEGTYRCPDSENCGDFAYLLVFNTRFVN